MAGIDLSALLPFMMGGGKNLNPQDLMAMMMQNGGNGGNSDVPHQNSAPPPPAGNAQMQILMQLMSMMNRPKPAPPVGFRPIDGICPCTELLRAMMRRKNNR